MVISKSKIQKIKELIRNHHKMIAIGLTKPGSGFVDDIYRNNNPEANPDLKETSLNILNTNLESLVEKQGDELASKIEGMIYSVNQSHKMQSLKNSKEVQEIIDDSAIGKLTKELEDSAGEAVDNLKRILVTEASNTVGMAALDRIASLTKDRDSDEVYVYKIIENDAKTCKYCREFYVDSDGSPRLHKLGTILANGSNYGKRRESYKPVAGATHPNERCSPILELKPGWKVLPGGSQTFIGLDKWDEYLKSKNVA